MEDDVKCIIDIKLEPLNDDVAEDPLAPRPSDYRFVEEHFNKTKRSDIKTEQTNILKREHNLSGVTNDACGIIDHNLDLNGDLKLPSSFTGEAFMDIGEEGASRTSPDGKQNACRIYSKANFTEQLKSDEEKVKKYFCCYCDFRSASIVVVSKHRTSVHTDIVPFTCTQCGYRAKKACLLNRHVSYNHRRNKLFKCSHKTCDYTSGDMISLRKHVSDVHKKKSYICSQCEFKAASVESMRSHFYLSHRKIYTSNQCDYKS